ncbi:MAG: efflux RND transporter periplasmic adaptor subunit [Gluconacetobacter diazotrophicus]|nr:efflux RND transporter periplasmic adaptor subunit [Gluconacetobacter diazotrophicus]
MSDGLHELATPFTSHHPDGPAGAPRRTGTAGRGWKRGLLGGAAILVAAGVAFALRGPDPVHAVPAAPPPAPVTVSQPLAEQLAPRTQFLGQFSAVDAVEIRPQVGGILTEIHFTDGQIVHKGDLLFVIDPRPYQIKLAQAVAAAQTAQARLTLAGSELWRAQQLKNSSYGTAQAVDQRGADQRANTAALAQAEQQIRDAQLDLEYCRVSAPFTGRISNHRVSVGALISGSRAGTSATTLLTTLMSLDPVHLDFDMSEADFQSFSRAHPHQDGMVGSPVAISLSDDGKFNTQGKLDFVDNAVDRGSGTLHARATVPNPELTIAPGEFARLRLQMGPPAPALLIPDAAVTLDQSQSIVMTVAPDGTVVPRIVQTGAIRDGLRVIRSGLKPDDRVIVDGLMHAMPGMKVSPQPGQIHPTSEEQG